MQLQAHRPPLVRSPLAIPAFAFPRRLHPAPRPGGRRDELGLSTGGCRSGVDWRAVNSRPADRAMQGNEKIGTPVGTTFA